MALIIAVDNGHGMETAGKCTPPLEQNLIINGDTIRKCGQVIHEKEWNRPVADKLMAALRRCGMQTVDVAPGLSDMPITQRWGAANAAKANLFISVHYNAYNALWNWGKVSPQKGYTLMFVSQYASGTAKLYAQTVQREIAKVTPWPNEGVQADYDYLGMNVGVLRNTNMPAVLTEFGFMDLWDHAAHMLNPSTQTNAAEAMCKGICACFGQPYVPAEVVPGIAPPPEASECYYAVQLGAYRQKQNAQAQLQAAQQLGYMGAYII